jgi:hypothetical protein
MLKAFLAEVYRQQTFVKIIFKLFVATLVGPSYREMEVLHEANWTRQVTDTLKRSE